MTQPASLNPAPRTARQSSSPGALAPPFAQEPPLFAMLSDPGRVRHANEDCCGARAEHNAFVLCDGMGGAAAGEIASQLARDTFLNSVASSAVSRIQPAGRLTEAVRLTNQAVYRHAQRTRAHRGMGTTLVGLLVAPGAVALAHVGDSRCYRLRAGRLELLTRDHSLIQEQIQAGLLTPADAAVSPIRNIITRAIGTYPIVEADILSVPAEPGDLFLLTSDGLTRELDDFEINRLLLSALPSPAGEPPSQSALKDACQSLIDAANARGGGDNITVLLVALS